MLWGNHIFFFSCGVQGVLTLSRFALPLFPLCCKGEAWKKSVTFLSSLLIIPTLHANQTNSCVRLEFVCLWELSQHRSDSVPPDIHAFLIAGLHFPSGSNKLSPWLCSVSTSALSFKATGRLDEYPARISFNLLFFTSGNLPPSSCLIEYCVGVWRCGAAAATSYRKCCASGCVVQHLFFLFFFEEFMTKGGMSTWNSTMDPRWEDCKVKFPAVEMCVNAV